MDISPSTVGLLLAGVGALAATSYAVVNASKAYWGGISNFGLARIHQGVLPFRAALEAALGDRWWSVIRANWINGLPKADQKATLQEIFRLGLRPETALSVADATHVDPAVLSSAVKKIEEGKSPNEVERRVVERAEATFRVVIGSTYELAEHGQTATTNVLVGAVAIMLALTGWRLWSASLPMEAPSLWEALAFGLAAIPTGVTARGGLDLVINALQRRVTPDSATQPAT